MSDMMRPARKANLRPMVAAMTRDRVDQIVQEALLCAGLFAAP
jgi:hypothetical protein